MRMQPTAHNIDVSRNIVPHGHSYTSLSTSELKPKDVSDWMSKPPFVLKKAVCNRYITVVNIISHDSENVEIKHLAVVFLLLPRDFTNELSKVACFIKMPEFRKDAIPPLSQDFFESLDRVDESALARLIVELNINRLQELPDLRTMFLQRRRQQLAYAHQLNRSFPGSGRAAMPQTQRQTPLQGRPWPVYV